MTGQKHERPNGTDVGLYSKRDLLDVGEVSQQGQHDLPCNVRDHEQRNILPNHERVSASRHDTMVDRALCWWDGIRKRVRGKGFDEN